MTIEHLLTMTCGIEWWEWGISIEDPANPYYNYSMSDNPIEYFLSLPMEYDPVDVWVYCSPAITVLSHILYRATGLTPLQFAEEYLFSSLGISTVYWITDNFGIECMSGALYLTPREMAKIGLLMTNHGCWNGTQIVSESWVNYSTSQIVEQPYHTITPGYGYLWWVSPENGFYCAQGRFGQRIYILPEYNIVLAITCNLNDYLIQPWDYFIDKFIIPAIIANWTPTSKVTSTTTPSSSVTSSTNLPVGGLLIPVAFLSTISIVVLLVWKIVDTRREDS